MHIPDNYLSPTTCAVMTVAVIPVWLVCLKKIKTDIPKSKIPLIGIGASFSFLLMMFNIPLPGGTTGHAVGGTLIALLLGPYAACISTSIALLIQAVIFGDGGILSFGANCFNLAFVLPFAGYSIYNFLKNHIHSKNRDKISIILSSYFALNLAALITAIEFGIQPILFKSASGAPLYCPYPISISIPAMLIPHLLVAGFVEAGFTLGIYSFIKKTSPDIIYEKENKSSFNSVFALIIGFILLTPLGLLATGTAWGEWGSDEIANISHNGNSIGFIPEGMKNGFSFSSLMPDYTLGGFSEVSAYIISAIIGVSLLIITFKIVSTLKRNAKS